MEKIWRFLRPVLCLALLLVGCATAPQVKVGVEVFDAEKAKSRSVAVVADLYMEDPVEAEKIAGMLRGQLAAHGFQVRETENDAELVVIPTIERSDTTATARPARMWRSFEPSYGLGRGGMAESQNALRALGFELGSAPPPSEQRKAGLMVTAVTREVWFSALLEKKSEVPRVWRIIAVSTLRKEEDVTEALMEAVGAKLNEFSSENTSLTSASTPNASPQRKPE